MERLKTMAGKRGVLRIKEVEVARVVRAAEKAGINVARVDVNPASGTISIIPANKPEVAPAEAAFEA